MNKDQIAAVVCVRKEDDPGVFKDNLDGVCSMCGHAIVYRPTVPKGPPKVCVECIVVPAGLRAN